MAKTTYWELLRDPRWQKMRLRIMERDDFGCQNCGAKDKTLNVHHKIYHKNHKPWEYEERELVTLCEECHERETHARARLNGALGLLPPLEVEYVLGYATAMVILYMSENNALGGKVVFDGGSEMRGVADGLSIDCADPEFGQMRSGMTVGELLELHLTSRQRRRRGIND